MSSEAPGTVLGSMAVSRGLITPEQLRDALEQQSRDSAEGKSRKLGTILLERGYLTAEQLAELLEARTPAAAGSVFGKYTLQKEIGRGGMGVVYLALDRDLDRRVALKLMFFHPHAEPDKLEQEEQRFLRETRLAAGVPKHPHVVGVYEGGVINAQRYMAMEFVHSRQFNEWRLTAPPLLAQVKVLRDVARAVHHAHEHGVIHRDLKPQNILIDPNGEPHVTDFGLAKTTRQGPGQSLTAPDVLVGTPAYMSPEQARLPKSVDRRTDVYALGVMLYEVMTGQAPFLGETPLDTLVKAAQDPVPLPSSLVPAERRAEIDPHLERVVLKALAKNADERYATAAALADELSAWVAAREANLPPTRRGRPWPAVAAGLLALGLAAWFILPGRGVAPAPPPVSPPAAALEILLGEAVGLGGLKLVPAGDARHEAVTYEGKPCVKLLPGTEHNRRLHFDVDDAHARRPGMVEVLVDYFDVPVGAFISLEYDSLDGRYPSDGSSKLAGKIYSRGSRAWKTAGFLLTNPRFRNGQGGKADFRITTSNNDVYFHSVRLRDGERPDLKPASGGVFPAAALDASSLRAGLAGEYYEDPDFRSLAHRRVDAGTAFGWSGRAWPDGPEDRFSVRWTGYVKVPRTGPYVFEIMVDDMGKVFVDDRAVIPNAKGRAPVAAQGACHLEAGLHRLRLELAEYEQRAELILSCFARDGARLELLGPEAFFHAPK